MNLQKLIAKGHMVPIYEEKDNEIVLVGYRRKESSRKSHQNPVLNKSPITIVKLPTYPEF